MYRFRNALNAVAIVVALLVTVASAWAQTAPAGKYAGAKYMGDGGVVHIPTNPTATSAWHFAAIQKYGLDKKHGIDIQLLPSATPTMTANLLQTGAAEVAIFSWVDLIRLRNNGVKVIGIAPFLRWGADHIIVPTDSTAKTIADLKGKKFGILSRTNLDFILNMAVAKTRYHLDPDKDFVIQEGATSLLRGLIETGALDGSQMFNNITPLMVAGGKVRILYQMKELVDSFGLPLTPELLYATSEDYAKAHPQNVRAFLAAYREGVDVLRNEDAIWDDRGKTMEMPPEAIALLRDEMRVDIWTEFAPTTQADIRKAFDFLVGQAGTAPFGFTEIPDGFITRDYD